MRKFLILIFLFMFTLLNSVCAEEMYKIRNVSFDTSASLIFINTYGNHHINITDNVKFSRNNDAHKVYFDINSSVLLCKKQDLYFTSGMIKQFKISQFTTNPNVVRCVLIFDDNYNIDNLKIGNINNNLIIATQNITSNFAQFYQNTYRDKRKNAEDYVCTNVLQEMSTVPKVMLLNSKENYSQRDLLQIKQSFDNSNAEEIKEFVRSSLSDGVTIRSRYFINNISVKNNGFLINGYGSPCIQQPFILSDPSRLVIDIVNSDFASKYQNQEIQLNKSGDTLRIGNFNKNTTRMVINSTNAKQYLPIFSPDNQSIFLIKPENLSSSVIVSNKSNITKYKYQKNISTEDLTLSFDQPVVWGMKRNKDKLYVYFLNAVRYNEASLKNTVKDTPYENTELALLKNIGIRLCLPLNANTDVNTYFSIDGKNFRIRTSGLKQESKPVIKPKKEEQPAKIYPKKLSGKIVVLDPGHGGTDYGAIRDGINEKDINLDVAKRVEDILRRRGIKVCMTRSSDVFVSLEDRSIISNDVNPIVFVSIHVNSCMGTEPKGIETHYYHDNSVELAEILHSKMINAISTNNRGLFKSRFYVINHTQAPAVLLEIGFISNAQERNELVTNKRKQATAQAIAEGIIEYINKQK